MLMKKKKIKNDLSLLKLLAEDQSNQNYLYKPTNYWKSNSFRTENNIRRLGIEEFRISADQLGDLLQRVRQGDFDNTRARDVFSHMLETGQSAEEAIKSLGIEAVDSSDIELLCRELLDANTQVIEDVKNGKQQAVGALIGQAKKKNANANPKQVRETLLKLIQQC